MLNPAGSPEKFVKIVQRRKWRENGQNGRVKIERAGLVETNPARLACN
jgi:hypothetical protein